MEILSLIAFLVLALPVVIIIFTTSRLRSDEGVKLPPGSLGWPIIGETIEFLFGKPEKFVRDRMEKYSPDIFKTKIHGEKTVVICGPNGHKFLFSNEEKLFTGFLCHPSKKLFWSSKAGPAPPVDQPAPQSDGGTRTDTDEAKSMLKAPGFFKPEALMMFLAEMDSTSQRYLETHWEGKDEVKVHPLSKTVTLTLACRFLMGIDNPERIARLVGHFDDITLGMHCLILNFPGTTFYRANKAAEAVRRELIAIIKEKKAAMETGSPALDVLSYMIIATDPTGKFIPEAEIADKIMGLLVAGYSTVATTLTFFMKYVGENPDIYNKVLSEQLEISKAKRPGEFLEWDDLSKMKYSWSVMCEVMRMVPPLQGTFREALTDITYAGYTIPKGWKVYWTVSTTSMNPNYFRDPEKFNPSRYEGNKPPPPYTYLPFGCGPRLCPGKDYARVVVLTFIHNVVKKFKWEVLIPNEKILGDMMPEPEKGIPIRLHRR